MSDQQSGKPGPGDAAAPSGQAGPAADGRGGDPIHGRVHDLARDLERADRYHEILRDFGRLTSSAASLDGLLTQAVRLIGRAIGVAHTKAMRYRPDQGDLLVVAGVGWREGLVGRWKLGIDMASPAGRALRTKQALLINDHRDAPGFRYNPVLAEHGILALVNAPIPLDGETWGVLEVDATSADIFDARDALFLESFAFQLGTAIRHLQDREALVTETEGAARQLARRELLAREEHHRVKNYFQTILAVLTLKSGGAATETTRGALKEVIDRVMAIALAHDLLVPRDGPAELRADDYVRALGSAVAAASCAVRIEVEAEPVELRSNQAVPLGLILNELLTNAVKYAGAGPAAAEGGTIVRVRLRVTAGGEAVLSVTDNGPGLTATPDRPGGTGLGLVRGLAGQLGGTLEVDSSPAGAAFTVIFPLEA